MSMSVGHSRNRCWCSFLAEERAVLIDVGEVCRMPTCSITNSNSMLGMNKLLNGMSLCSWIGMPQTHLYPQNNNCLDACHKTRQKETYSAKAQTHCNA